MGYSIDLRERVIEAEEKGMTQREIEEIFKVSSGSIKRWKKLKEETGSLNPRKRTSESFDFKRGIPNHKLEKFKEFVLENNEMTYEEIANAWSISDTAVGRYLKRLRITRKKRHLFLKKETKRKGINGKKK